MGEDNRMMERMVPPDGFLQEMLSFVPEPGHLAFWWLGQMGFAVKVGGTLLFLDAFLSPHPRRNIPPAVDVDAQVTADLVFGTHDHVDHIDREAWLHMARASAQTRFVVPEHHRASVLKQLSVAPERVIGMDEGPAVHVGVLVIRAIPSAHEFLDTAPDTGMHPYLGYILEAEGRRIYHAGDTCLYEGMQSRLREAGPFDVMFIPINGRDGERYRRGTIGNMTEQEAVDLVGPLRPGLVVPGHYEMFTRNPGNPALFADYLDAKYPGVPCWMGPHFTRVDI